LTTSMLDTLCSTMALSLMASVFVVTWASKIVQATLLSTVLTLVLSGLVILSNLLNYAVFKAHHLLMGFFLD
ncbi:hypothetical protein, partial [Legionella sp.]|uniref:hypothetical protein n=1 Tax=Legionella sp. TaxID=459 RepID=UPI00321FB6B8